MGTTSYRDSLDTKEKYLTDNNLKNSWFEDRYWVEGETTATLDTSLPFNFYGSNLDQDYSGTIKHMSFWPSNCEIVSAELTFHRTIQKNFDFSGYMEWEYATSSKVTCPIGFAHGNNYDNVVSFWNPQNLYNIMDGGNGTRVTVRIKKNNKKEFSSGAYLMQFQSSRSYAEDAAGHGNGSKFELRVKYRYDPAEAYSASYARFSNYSARACDISDVSNLRDVNHFTARIIPHNDDANIFHVVKWYTRLGKNDNTSSILTWYDDNGNGHQAYDEWEVHYKSDKSHLEVRYPVPQEWCWAWPNSNIGWGFFELETWYIYKPINEFKNEEKPPNLIVKIGQLPQPIELVVETPDYIKPVITSATLNVLPVSYPGSDEINALSDTWVRGHAYVQNYCAVQLSVTGAKGALGSSITQIVFAEQFYSRMRRTIEIDGGRGKRVIYDTKDDRVQTSMRVTGAGQLVFAAYAKDSRGKYSDTFYIPVDTSPSSALSGITYKELPFLDDDGNETGQTYQALLVTQYGKPQFDVHKSYRVNEHDDISENGKYPCVEASATHTQVLLYDDNGSTDGEDANPVRIYYRIKMDDSSTWYPNTEFGLIRVQNGRNKYEDMQVFPSAKYTIQLILDDKMTEELNKIAELKPQDDNSYSIKLTEPLGTGDCTVFLKRNGLGVSIGTAPYTEKNYRCLEIAENWEIRHGQEEDGTVYYIPDIVFTPAGYKIPPKKRKGRIWLQEVG